MSAAEQIPGNAVPHLPRGVRFTHDPKRERWVLLAPERILEPDEIAVEILQRIDGTRTVDEIVDRLAEAFEADRDEVAADVRDFMTELIDKRVLVL